MPNLPGLEQALDRVEREGYLVDAAGTESDQYYLSGFLSEDSFVTLYANDTVSMLVPAPEVDRAQADSRADDVQARSTFGYREYAQEMDPRVARKRVIVDWLKDTDITSVSVPVSFPAGTADLLRTHEIDVDVDYEYNLRQARAIKTDREIEYIRRTQTANEEAMAAAEAMLEQATISDGVLHLDGAVLTSERVRRTIKRTLIDQDCELDRCIVAGGPAGARAHDTGSGPLPAHTPIIIDIFPRDTETRYYGDMTRTFVKGTPSQQLQDWYQVTQAAYDAALQRIEAGVSGETVHDAACEIFEDAGYPTLRTTDTPANGFFHTTGHGVGLDVHESPHLAAQGGELQPGHVVSVEPGLYQQGTGGVRLEDLVVVTEDGYTTLNEYPQTLRIV